MRVIRVGDIVSPSHVGEDATGRKISWILYRGRILQIYSEGSRSYALMAWFGEAKAVMPTTYPLDLLELAR